MTGGATQGSSASENDCWIIYSWPIWNLRVPSLQASAVPRGGCALLSQLFPSATKGDEVGGAELDVDGELRGQ